MSRNATQLKTTVRRLRRLTALTGAVAIVFAAATVAPAMAYQDLRSPDASDAFDQSSVKYGAPSTPAVPQTAQDLRSPDATDAGAQSSVDHSSALSGDLARPAQDLRSADASDAGSVAASETGSSSSGSSDNFEWGYLALAGFAALVIGGSMTVVRRRRTRRLVATH
jgi:hypothetical protein